MKKKATAGERFCMWAFEMTLAGVRKHAHATAKKLDRLLARERAKVAYDVMNIAYGCGAVNGGSYYTLREAYEAKYGKGKR